MSTPRTEAVGIFEAGVATAAPPSVLPDVGVDGDGVLHVGRLRVPFTGLQRIVVVGAGKAAERLCVAVTTALRVHGPSTCDVSALILAPETPARVESPFDEDAGLGLGPEGLEATTQVIRVRPPDDNAPTEAAVAATRRVLEVVRGLGEDDVLICGFTGGGSATLCAPAVGLSLDDVREATHLLETDGATIEAINTLRRHLSDVKGGRLAQAATGARAVHSLLVSDVDGDVPHVIAGGPAVPDPTSFADALALRAEWPEAVRRHLLAGTRGEVPETPTSLPANVTWEVVLSPDDALRGAAERAAAHGWNVVTLPRPTPADVDACVAAHIDAARGAPAGTAVLSVGEAPLALPPSPPAGGRAGHLALALALAADADPALRGRVTVLVGGTDGEDGTSGTAGAVVDPDVLARARDAGLDPARHLARRESLAFLHAAGGVLPRAVTGTNVQDLRVLLVGEVPPAEPA